MAQKSDPKNGPDDITLSIQRHEAALEALKGVPEILNQLAKKAGVQVEPKQKPSWSLGLSDDENEEIDLDADANKMIDDQNDPDEELDDLLKDIEKTVEYGPPLLPNVCIGFVKTAARPLTKESKASVKERIRIPENCKEFIVPKVNAEIWRLLPAQAKMNDIKQQQQQQILSLGLSSIASIANTVASHKDQIPKEVVSSVLKQAIDGANLLGDNFQSMTGRRRFEMKKFLNPEYSGICAAQLPTSEWLFGSDLAESLKSSKATASLMKSTMNRNIRYNPYPQFRQNQQQNQASTSNSLNFNRPLYQPFRGNNGQQQQQRFNRRPQVQGQFRMLNPTYQQNQQRFRRF